MRDIPQELEAYPVHHRPIMKAYADQRGLVEVINPLVPTEMDIDPGTIVLGMILDTFSGRSPLDRLEAFFAQHDTERLLGKAVPAEVFNDDTVGRVLDRLYEAGTTKLFTACAVRADQVFGFDKRDVHVDTTSVSVYGDDLPPEELPEHEVPFTITHGYSTDKRPDLKPFVLSTRCVDRAVPIGGHPEDGNAADKTLNTTRLAEVAHLLAQHGVPPGAYIYVADAALVTEDHLAALGDTFFVSRLPATSNACGRVIAEAVAQENWDEVGVLAHTKPTKHRPGASYNVAESAVTLDGQAYRAVVVPSSTQDQRRLKRREREVQASDATLRDTVRVAQQRDDFCRADAEAAAAYLRMMPSAYHQVEVQVEERPKDGKGRPSTRLPRPVQEMH
jgi:transposase